MATKATMQGIEYFIKGDWVFLKIPRAVLLFTKDEWINGLKRGKGWKRNQVMARRARAAGGVIQ
jgi:hypothetical protein